MAKKIYERENLVEFDDDGLPHKLVRMTFTVPELTTVRQGLAAGSVYLEMGNYEEVQPVTDAAHAFFEAESWARGARDCE